MSQVAEELFDNWVEKNAPPGLFDLEKESEPQQDKPPASSTSAKGTGGKGKGVKDE